MASNSVSIARLLPFMTLAPIGLAHCIGSTEMAELADGGPMATPPDGGPQPAGDSGTKTQDDSGTKTQDDSGTKTGDASSKQPADGPTPPGRRRRAGHPARCRKRPARSRIGPVQRRAL